LSFFLSLPPPILLSFLSFPFLFSSFSISPSVPPAFYLILPFLLLLLVSHFLLHFLSIFYSLFPSPSLPTPSPFPPLLLHLFLSIFFFSYSTFPFPPFCTLLSFSPFILFLFFYASSFSFYSISSSMFFPYSTFFYLPLPICTVAPPSLSLRLLPFLLAFSSSSYSIFSCSSPFSPILPFPLFFHHILLFCLLFILFSSYPSCPLV
jgi:hypothetical protein